MTGRRGSSWLWVAACVVGGAASARAAENPNPWEEVVNDEGLILWARDVPNSNLREVKGEMIVPVSPARMWEVISDTARYIEFVPNVVEGRMLSQGPTHYEYFRINPPLVSLRDYTLRIVDIADKDNATYRRSWNIDNSKGPPARDDCVRMTYYNGSWTITGEGKGTKVLYWSVNDPGGSIPAFIVRKSTLGTVEDLLRAMKARAVEPGYVR